MNILLKRAYDPPSAEDGERYLVDRLWPRGLKRESLKLAGWLKDVAPSNELRKQFHHDIARWDEFRERYFQELDANASGWQALLEAARHGPVTLVYGAKDHGAQPGGRLKRIFGAPGQMR